MKKYWIFLSAFVALNSHAFTAKEYEQQAKALEASQRHSEEFISRLSQSVGFSGPGAAGLPPTPGQEEKPSPLFRVHASSSTAFLPPGKTILARTVTRLVVGGEGSPALIEIEPGQGWLSGLRFMGVARQGSTQGRLNVDLNRLLLKSGKAVSVQATALDISGAYGIEAQVFSGKALAVAGAMASSFVAGLAASQQSQSTNAFGFNQTQTTGRNAILQGVAQTAADQSKRLIDEATAEKPILVLDPATPVSILIQEEVRL